METYYHPKDLAKFGDMGEEAPELKKVTEVSELEMMAAAPRCANKRTTTATIRRFIRTSRVL